MMCWCSNNPALCIQVQTLCMCLKSQWCKATNCGIMTELLKIRILSRKSDIIVLWIVSSSRQDGPSRPVKESSLGLGWRKAECLTSLSNFAIMFVDILVLKWLATNTSTSRTHRSCFHWYWTSGYIIPLWNHVCKAKYKLSVIFWDKLYLKKRKKTRLIKQINPCHYNTTQRQQVE